MGALVFLELRYAAHQAAAVLRSPARLALWLAYAASIAFFSYTRTMHRHAGSYRGFTLGPEQSIALGSAYLAMLCAGIALAAGGRVNAFRTGAEAIFFSNAGVPPLSVVVWLQLRKVAAGWTRLFGGVLYVFLLFAPYHANAAATLRALLATLLALALQQTVELPAFLLARGRPNAIIRSAAWVAAACALAVAAVGFFAERLLAGVPYLAYFGASVQAVLGGSPRAIGVLATLLGVLVVSIAVLGSDALPEIYEASLQTLVQQRRTRTAPVSFALGRTSKAARIPPGALTLVWKDWIGFRRGRGALRLWLAACAVCALCGAGAAFVATRFGDAGPLISLGALTVVMVFVLAPLGSAAGLAADLGKPIFWLSPAPLRARIAAWTFARAWRGAIAIGLAPFAAGIVGHNATLALAALPIMFATYWALQALGVGLYALFPNPIDARGPLAFVRSIVTLLFMLPPLVIATVALALHATALEAAVGSALAFVAEGTLAVELASHRFSERGAIVATLSRAV